MNHVAGHCTIWWVLHSEAGGDCALVTVRSRDAVKRSRAKRWGRVLDSHTWPEVLRRYLLATRAGLPMSDEQLAAADVADLGADAVAVHAALQLGRQPWWTLSAALHAMLLSVLCDDIVQGTRLRADINLRFEEITALHVRAAGVSVGTAFCSFRAAFLFAPDLWCVLLLHATGTQSCYQNTTYTGLLLLLTVTISI